MGKGGDGIGMAGRGDLRPERLVDAIVDHLERLTLDGALAVGEKLVAGEELASRLNVSITLLRKACDRLTERGVLLDQGDGAYVLASTDGAHFSTPLAYLLHAHPGATFDYLEFRCVVEGEAARLAAERGTDADRAELTRRFVAIEARHEQDDPTEEADADAEFHLAIYEMTHNMVLLHIMRGFSSMLRKDVFYSRNRIYAKPGVRQTLLDQHRAIYQAILERDPIRARDAAAAHMNFTRASIEEMNKADARLEASLRRMGRSSLVETD